jgi:hypothetical protein
MKRRTGTGTACVCPLEPSESYTLTIRIQNVDPNAPKIELIPTLEGGQLDLP